MVTRESIIENLEAVRAYLDSKCEHGDMASIRLNNEGGVFYSVGMGESFHGNILSIANMVIDNE